MSDIFSLERPWRAYLRHYSHMLSDGTFFTIHYWQP